MLFKKIKHLAENSFSVFNGVWSRSVENTNIFVGQMFLLFFINVFFLYHFKIFKNINLLVLSICVIFCSHAFQYLCYKKVFLDENPKTWRKHRKNRKTLPWEHHIGCQMCQIALSKSTEKKRKKYRSDFLCEEVAWLFV